MVEQLLRCYTVSSIQWMSSQLISARTGTNKMFSIKQNICQGFSSKLCLIPWTGWNTVETLLKHCWNTQKPWLVLMRSRSSGQAHQPHGKLAILGGLSHLAGKGHQVVLHHRPVSGPKLEDVVAGSWTSAEHIWKLERLALCWSWPATTFSPSTWCLGVQGLNGWCKLNSVVWLAVGSGSTPVSRRDCWMLSFNYACRRYASLCRAILLGNDMGDSFVFRGMSVMFCSLLDTLGIFWMTRIPALTHNEACMLQKDYRDRGSCPKSESIFLIHHDISDMENKSNNSSLLITLALKIDCSRGSKVIFPFQFASFLMTLVRKGIITTKGFHAGGLAMTR